MTNRKIPVDDPADNAPCRRPAWIAETVDRARALGLTPAQREAIAWLLATAELDDAPLPRITVRPPMVSLLWVSDERALHADLCWTPRGWAVHLVAHRRNVREVDARPRHPADLLRTMLKTVFPPEGR
jgi:hypothetical protein